MSLSIPQRLALLCLVLTLGACNVPERWLIAAYDAYPTAVDYLHDERLFLIGGYADGTIHALRHDGSLVARPFLVPGGSGPRKALRLRVDNARDRLWILDRDAAYVYATRERRLLARIALPLSPLDLRSCLPDLALDESTGLAYISDPLRPVLHVISQNGTGGGYALRSIVLEATNGARPEGFSALAVLPYERALVAGSSASGRLWRVHAHARTVEEIALPDTLAIAGVCGMRASAPESAHPYGMPGNHHVFLTTGRAGRVIRLHLSPGAKWAAVKQVAPLVPLDDPVGLVVMQGYLAVTNSQLTRHPDFGGDGDPAMPFRLAIMPAEHEALGPIAGGR